MATETLEGANTLVHSKQTTDPNICPKAVFTPECPSVYWCMCFTVLVLGTHKHKAPGGRGCPCTSRYTETLVSPPFPNRLASLDRRSDEETCAHVGARRPAVWHARVVV